MDAPSSNSSADSAGLLTRAILAGMAELALCRSWAAGLLIIAGFVPFSPGACGLALLGASAATAWPFWRQRDVRLLNSGWYGVNGALCGFLVDWHFADPLGAVLLTVLAAWMAAMILDAVVVPLGDAPVGLPPLTLPFLVIAAVLTLSAQNLQAGLERLAAAEAPAPAPRGWSPPPLEAEDAAAWAAYGAGNHLAARAGFLRLAETAPDRAEPWNGLGWSQFRQGDVHGAARSFRKALALEPGHPYALDGLGWAVYARGRYGEAQGLFRRALGGAGADAVAGLGWVDLRQHRYEAALERFSEAVALDRTSIAAREGLGRALMALGRHRESESVFLDLLGRSPVAIRGLADARRLLLLEGAPLAADPREWGEVAGFLGWKVLALAVLAATVLLWTPVAGLVGLSLMAAGMIVTAWLAGPSSLLWIDLHLQTVAMTGLLMGRSRQLHHLWGGALVVAAAIAVWAVSHRLGVWLPLLSFNMAGFAGLLLLRRPEERFRMEAGGSIFSPSSPDRL